MDIISCLQDQAQWQQFLSARQEGGHSSPGEEKALAEFIRSGAYLAPCEKAARGESFSPPRKVAISKLDGSFLKMITSLEKNDLIILDDFGLQPMDMNTRLALLQILEERYERKSVIIASQLPIAKWYDYIGDATLADAIMDRLVANANKIELKGESMRQRKKK